MYIVGCILWLAGAVIFAVNYFNPDALREAVLGLAFMVLALEATKKEKC